MPDNPAITGHYTPPEDTLCLTPADDPVVGLGLGATTEGRIFPTITIAFRDDLAGHISIALDTRTGHIERIYAALDRCLNAIHHPDEHPEDAQQITEALHRLAQDYLGGTDA